MLGNVVGVTVIVGQAIAILKLFVAVQAVELESEICTVKLEVPAPVVPFGVPLITPALLNDNPTGNEPVEIE